MTFQPINFAGIPIQRGSFLPEDLVQSFMQAKQMPGQSRRKAEEEELGNAIQQLKLEELKNPRVDKLAKKMKEQQLLSLEFKNDPNKQYSQFIDQLGKLKEAGQIDTKQADELANMFLRQIHGIGGELPSEKSQRENETLDKKFAQERQLEQEKSGYRQQENAAKQKEDVTQKTKTANQAIIQSIDNTLPSIEKLINLGSGPANLSYDKAIEANTLRATITDTLMSSLNLPSTSEGLKVIKEIVDRKFGETAVHYKKRLEDLSIDLIERRQRAEKTLKSGNIYDGKKDAMSLLKKMGVKEAEIKRLFDEESALPSFSVNGKVFDIPSDEIEEFLKDHPNAKKM